jgi:WD40 repeat protein
VRRRGGLTEAVSFSPDGQQLLWTRNGLVAIIDLATGQDITPKYLTSLRNVRVYVLHDGRHLIHDTGISHSCWLVDPKTGQRTSDLDLDGQKAYSVHQTPDGKGALIWWSCNSGCGASVFDFTVEKPVVKHFRLPIWSAYALSPDRKRVYATSANNLDVYDFETGNKLESISPGTGQNARPLVSVDGKTVLLADSGRLFVCPVTKDGIGSATELPRPNVNIDFSYAVTTPTGGQLQIPTTGQLIDLKTGAVTPPRTDHKRTNRTGCQHSADGRFACDVFGSLGLIVRDSVSGKTVREILTLPELRTAVITNDRTLTTLDSEMASRVYDLATGQLLEERTKRSGADHGPRWGTLADDSGLILESELNTPKTRLTNTKTGMEIAVLDHRLIGVINGAHLDPESNQVLLTVQGKTALLELSTGKLLRHLPTSTSAAAFSPNGRLIATAMGAQLSLIETATNKERRTFVTSVVNPRQYDETTQVGRRPVPQPGANSGQAGIIRFTADGDIVALFTGEGRILVWSVSDGTLLHQDVAPVGRRNGAISPNGRWLVIASPDQNTLVLRDLNEPKVGVGTYSISESRSPVQHVTFTADSKRFVTSHADGLAYLWDVEEIVALGKTQSTLASNEELWAALADADAAKAGKTVDELVRNPTVALRVLTAVQPVQKPAAKRVATLIEELGDREYKVREAAEKQLLELRELVAAELHAVIGSSESAEQQERANTLIGKLTAAETNPERMRHLRAIEILERIGTAEAKKVLDRLATGAAESTITREAKRAAARIDQRRPR